MPFSGKVEVAAATRRLEQPAITVDKEEIMKRTTYIAAVEAKRPDEIYDPRTQQ
jgi:hypothetical protein